MIKIRVLIFIITSLIFTNAYSEDREQFTFNKTVIGSILESESASGCGCYFYYPEEDQSYGSSILQIEVGEKGIFHINGKTIRLKPEGKAYDSQSHVGGKALFNLNAKNVNIKADLKAIKVCPKEHESCEVTDYSVTLSITSQKGQVIIPAWGQCGC